MFKYYSLRKKILHQYLINRKSFLFLNFIVFNENQIVKLIILKSLSCGVGCSGVWTYFSILFRFHCHENKSNI